MGSGFIGLNKVSEIIQSTLRRGDGGFVPLIIRYLLFVRRTAAAPSNLVLVSCLYYRHVSNFEVLVESQISKGNDDDEKAALFLFS